MANTLNHLGLILDGNRRWAKKRGLPTLRGHLKGFEVLKKIANYAYKKGVKILTLYLFSTENWNRTKSEVSYLMRLLTKAFNRNYINELNKKGIKLKVIGQKQKLSNFLREKIKKAENSTKNNKKGILVLAISYGGRLEIIEAVKKIILKKIPATKINENLLEQNLWTKNLCHPDLIIRTGGEKRLSNFLIWQSAYSELYFSPKLWPDFSEKDLDKAIFDYKRRQRRFGK